MKDERKASAIAFLEAALAYYATLGIKIERVMTSSTAETHSLAGTGD
jgi:hypothetical protein